VSSNIILRVEVLFDTIIWLEAPLGSFVMWAVMVRPGNDNTLRNPLHFSANIHNEARALFSSGSIIWLQLVIDTNQVNLMVRFGVEYNSVWFGSRQY